MIEAIQSNVFGNGNCNVRGSDDGEVLSDVVSGNDTGVEIEAPKADEDSDVLVTHEGGCNDNYLTPYSKKDRDDDGDGYDSCNGNSPDTPVSAATPVHAMPAKTGANTMSPEALVNAVDSGATRHLNPDCHNLVNVVPYKVEVNGFNKSVTCSTHRGDERVMVHTATGWAPMVKKKVLVVPGLRHKLFSMKRFISAGHSAVFAKEHSYLILSSGVRIPVNLDEKNGMFVMETRTPKKGEFDTMRPSAMNAQVRPEIGEITGSVRFDLGSPKSVEKDFLRPSPATPVAAQNGRVTNREETITEATVTPDTDDTAQLMSNVDLVRVSDTDYDKLIQAVMDAAEMPMQSPVQQEAKRIHYSSGHTNIRDLIKISPTLNGMESLWNLPQSFKLEPPCLICHMAKSRRRPLPKGPVQRAT